MTNKLKHTASEPEPFQEVISALSSFQLDELAKELPLIKLWITAIEAELTYRLSLGESFNYAGMRPKLAVRKWTDEMSVLAILTQHIPLDEAAPRVLLSPAKTEKILGKRFSILAPFVQKTSSGQALGLINPDKSIFVTEN